MRILAVNNKMPPEAWYGAEKQVFYRLKWFREKGHDVSCITASIESKKDTDTYNGVKLYYVNQFQFRRKQKKKSLFSGVNWLMNDTYNPFVMRKCMSIIKKEDPQIVWVRNLAQLSFAPVIAAKKLNKKVVVTPADHWWMCYLNKPLKTCYGLAGNKCATCLSENGNLKISPTLIPFCNLLLSMVNKKKLRFFEEFDYCIFNSKYTKELYEKHISNLPENSLIYNPGIIDVVKTPIVKKRKGKTVLYVGSLTPSKGVNLLLHAMKNVKAELLIIGDGPEEGHLKQLANYLNIKASFIGRIIENDVLSSYYAISDCVVIPSRDPETLGAVALEAFAHGKPVVTTTTSGAVLEVVDSENGAISDYSADELSAAINKVLKKKYLKNKLLYKKQFSYPALFDQYIKTFEGLL